MDRRRSSEEEAQLDKKIALIREKNAKIVEKAKEVEAERELLGDQPKERKKSNQMKENPKPVNQNNRRKSSAKDDAFDREWDKGKTPVEKWRENVPSIENVDRRARGRGRGGGMGMGANHGRRGTGARGGASAGRLDGRVTRVSNEGEEMALDVNGGRRRGGRGGHRNGGERKVVSGGGDMKIEIRNLSSNGEDQPARRRNQRERKPREPKGEGEEEEGEEGEDGEKKPRQRQNDKYVIRQILRRVVDRVVQTEKYEKRVIERARKEKEREEKGEEVKEEKKEKEDEKKEDEKEKKEEKKEEVVEKKEEEKSPSPVPEVKKEEEKKEEKNNNTDAPVATVVALAVEEVAVIQETVTAS